MRIYLDNAATTRVDDRVLAAMMPYFTETYGNPSALHRMGIDAEAGVRRARGQVASALGCAADELVFTSGGSEADAMGVLGAARAARGRHVVISAVEHPAVAESARLLAAEGRRLTEVAPGPGGVVDPAAFAAVVEPDTALAALVLVQNEVGTVQPAAEVVRAVRARAPRCRIHVDAVQALGKLPLDVRAIGCDTLAVSAHKLHGPKGVGALYVRGGVRLAPLWGGGKQEGERRPGTENVAGIAGFGAAAELAVAALATAAPRMAALRDRMTQAIAAAVPGARLLGEPAALAPSHACFAIARTPSEPLLHALEARGVYASAGSACAARSRKRSPIFAALGVPEDAAILRLTLSAATAAEEIDAAAAAVAEAVREVSR